MHEVICLFLGWGTLGSLYLVIKLKGGTESEFQAYSLYKYLCLWTLCLFIFAYARICLRPRGAVFGKCKWGACMDYYDEQGNVLPR
jgi:hypothetical protein